MNEISTTQTELVKKTNNCEIKQTAMDRILTRALENDIDMDRLERLIALREKEIERQNYQSFVSNLSAMQMEYQKIQKNALNTHTKSTYATLNQYIDAVKDTLAKYHFALFSRIKSQTATNVTIEITLSHPSSNQISTEGTFPIDGQGSKNNIQSVGSTITYARRYLLGMLLNVTSDEDDTDGNTLIAGVTPEQMNEIRELMEQTQAKESDILSFIGVKNLTQMSYKQAQTVLFTLKKKQRSQMNKAPQEQQKAV